MSDPSFNIPALPPVAANSQPVQTITPQERKRLEGATADFEAMFIKQLLTAMRKTIPKGEEGGLFKESQGEKIFRDLLDGEYAKVMSRGGQGIGLKEAMLKQLLGPDNATVLPRGRRGG